MTRLYVHSGGTTVTVTGNQLDSVANARIRLTVVITNITTMSTSSSEVIIISSISIVV